MKIIFRDILDFINGVLYETQAVVSTATHFNQQIPDPQQFFL